MPESCSLQTTLVWKQHSLWSDDYIYISKQFLDKVLATKHQLCVLLMDTEVETDPDL